MRYLIVVALFPLCAHAQFKCLAPDGVTEYRSTPCPTNSRPLNRGAVVEGPSSDAPTGPSYYQREAARLERKEAAERAEGEAWMQQQRSNERNQAAARQAAIDSAAADKKAAADAKKAAAKANRPVFCSGTSIYLGGGMSTGTSVCN